jgi:hypothetical protein
MGLMSPA